MFKQALYGLGVAAYLGSNINGCSGEVDPPTGCPGCAGDAGRPPDGASAGSHDGSHDAGGDGSSPPEDGGATWPSGPIRPRRFRIADPAVVRPPCPNTGNGTLTASEILLGQTHLTPRGWPFQTISANRPLTIAVAAQGTGAAPAITATARLAGNALTLCLTGPSALPASRGDLETSTYRASLPAAWVQPGLQLELSVAGRNETVTLDVKAENGLTLYLVSAALFGRGENTAPSDAQLREFLARLPVSYLDVAVNPFGVWRPTRLLLGPRSDGLTPTGVSTSHGPLLISELPHCSAADKSNGTCAPQSGFGTMAAVLGALDTFREANGVQDSSTWYADLAVALGGGLAGGQRGTGDDTGLTMNHELGHAWGFPHWAAANTDYPYEGVRSERGGFGDRWALDQVSGRLWSPSCEGRERQSPMQRSGATCLPSGSWYDPFSDYESARLLRMTLGASAEVTGRVAYSGGVLEESDRAFRLPPESGRPRMVWRADGPGLHFERYDEASNTFKPAASESWNRIEEAEVPVMMFSGAVIVGGATHFEAGIEYVGNVLRGLDPSRSEDYAFLYARRSSDFYWARDLNLRFTLEDGSVFTRLYGREAVLRQDGDHAQFAFNLPAAIGKRVTKLEVLSRPLGHYSTDSRLTTTDNAENYFSRARVLATWQRR